MTALLTAPRLEVIPRHHTARNYSRPTRGPMVAKIAAAKGRPFMPWQRRAADVAHELDPETGRYWYGIVIVTVQRQAGKTTLEGDVADARCLTTPRGRAWFTMQRGKDAAAWMRDEHFPALAGAQIFGTPGTAGCRYRLSRRAGSEGVEWPALGSTFRAFAPTRDGLHSKQADLVMVDEAWAFDLERGNELRQAIRPTMATRKGSQLWILSTKGDASSVYLDEYVALGIASLSDPETRVCFIDYGIPDADSPDAIDPDDLEALAGFHPAYGHTIDMPALVDARADFGEDVAGWARAYGNRSTSARVSIWPRELWADLGMLRPDAVPDRAGLAFDVTPKGDRLAINAAWRAEHAGEPDHAFLEQLYAGPATREAPAMLAQLARARGVPLALDPKSPGALEILDVLTRDHPKVDTVPVSTGDYAAACLSITRGVFGRTLHHFRDPDLTAATEVATTRPLLDGGIGWARKGSTGSIAELVGATLALRAFDTMPAPRRKPVARAGSKRH